MTLNLDRYLNQNHYADIETKGFWEDVHSPEDIWCLCSVTEDDEVILFHDYPEFDNQKITDPYDEKEYTIPPRSGTLLDGARYWYKIGMKKGLLVIHNCRGYDKPIIEKVWPKCKIPVETYHDTFLQSKLQWHGRPIPKGAKGAHGLKAYGIRHGINKPDIDDWKTMDAFKLHRVIEDCRIQKKTFEYLETERIALKDTLGIDFSEAMEIEGRYTDNCFVQEVNGALADIEHMKKCVEWLDVKTAELACKIEPNLPPTVKPKSTKIGRKELASLLGYKQDVPDIIDAEGKVVKQYYKPSTNFHKTEKVNVYSGFNISYGASLKYNKKKLLTDWIKQNHPETKPKDWNIEKEVEETKVLNANACVYFGVDPTDTDLICGAHTRVEFIPSKMSQHEVVKGYLIKNGLKRVEEWNIKKDKDGRMVRAEEDTLVVFPKKAAPEFQLKRLCKKRDLLVTTPKLSEKDYEQLPEGMGQDIAQYNTYMHRRRYLSNIKDPEHKGLLAYVREDGRLPCGVNNFSTDTGRSSHRVIVNLPSESALYGKEMRQSIIAPEGKVLIGADQKSSQLAIAAFVTNNTQYYDAVASGQEFEKDEEGNDIYRGSSAHCINARNFGLVTKAEWQEAIDTQNPELIHEIVLKRKTAKGPAFALLFGCAAAKLATMLGIPLKEGERRKSMFLEEMGLNKVIEFLAECEIKYKRGNGFYIPTAFGYWVFCKSSHAAVNYLIQSMEGAVQKMGVLRFEELLVENNLKDKVLKILDMHDEHLVETYPDIAESVGKLMNEAYTWAGQQLQLWYMNNLDKYPAGGEPNIVPDFAGGYAVGASYYDCH